MGLAVSQKFATLRDQHHVNEIDPTQLRTLRKLGAPVAVAVGMPLSGRVYYVTYQY